MAKSQATKTQIPEPPAEISAAGSLAVEVAPETVGDSFDPILPKHPEDMAPPDEMTPEYWIG